MSATVIETAQNIIILGSFSRAIISIMRQACAEVSLSPHAITVLELAQEEGPTIKHKVLEERFLQSHASRPEGVRQDVNSAKRELLKRGYVVKAGSRSH